MESPWPARLSSRPLPFEIISYMKLDIHQCEMTPMDTFLKTLPEPRVDPQADEPPRIWLIDETDHGTIRSIGVSKTRFLIGRDSACHLPLTSPHVSKRHAAIERRGGLHFLRDLGSKNGTRLNGRLLRTQDAEIHAGDRIGVGDLRFIVAAIPQGRSASTIGSLGAAEDWIVERVRDDDDPASTLPVGNAPTLQDFSVHQDLDDPRPFKYEVIEDILVITPRIHQVSDDSAVAALRSTLQELFDHPLPRRVVVSLEFVSNLSPQAIGVILAHQLRLERAGGAFRLCNARHQLMAILDRIHFTMLMECYPTLDDAILVAWH
jgi:anti-anti-sigma regulatory factor